MTSRSVGAQTLARALGRGVRTPLHSVLGFLELLSMTDLDDDQQRLLDEAMSGADALVGETDRVLLLLASPDNKQINHEVQLRELLTESLLDVPGASAVGVHIASDVPARITTDSSAVRQIVRELVVNALTHGAAPATIGVERTPVDGTLPGLRISVEDRGPGLPGEVSAALKAGTSLPNHGTGVGLLIVQRLATTLDGQLSADLHGVSLCLALTEPAAPAEPAAPGRPEPISSPAVAGAAVEEPGGTPTAEPPSDGTAADGTAADRTAAAGHAPAAPPSGRPLRILLAEDNAFNRLLAQRQLARLGHQVTTAHNGVDAVAAAATEAFDVILLDRHMPDLDGLEVARRLRAAEGDGPRTPILAVTADASHRAREECLAAGMDGYLTKPLDIGGLAAALATYAGPGQDPSRTGLCPLDPATLQALSGQLGGDPDRVDEVLEDYLAELAVRRLRIDAAARRGELELLREAAQCLRLASASIGALALARTCAAVVTAEDLTGARLALKALPVQHHQVQQSLVSRAKLRPAR